MAGVPAADFRPEAGVCLVGVASTGVDWIFLGEACCLGDVGRTGVDLAEEVGVVTSRREVGAGRAGDSPFSFWLRRAFWASLREGRYAHRSSPICKYAYL